MPKAPPERRFPRSKNVADRRAAQPEDDRGRDGIQVGSATAEASFISETRILVKGNYAGQFMDRSGPRIRANRKEQKVLLSLLRAVRVEAGLRQTDMALALKVPQSYVSKYESGERRLDPLELHAVCKAAGISLAVFGGRLDELLN